MPTQGGPTGRARARPVSFVFQFIDCDVTIDTTEAAAPPSSRRHRPVAPRPMERSRCPASRGAVPLPRVPWSGPVAPRPMERSRCPAPRGAVPLPRASWCGPVAVGRDVPIAPHRPVAVRTTRAPLPRPMVRPRCPRIACARGAIPLR